MKVFELRHLDPRTMDEGYVRYLGYFSTEAQVRIAIEEAKTQPIYQENPLGFVAVECAVKGEMINTETIYEAYVKFETKNKEYMRRYSLGIFGDETAAKACASDFDAKYDHKALENMVVSVAVSGIELNRFVERDVALLL